MSQPPKSTIFAPSARWVALRMVCWVMMIRCQSRDVHYRGRRAVFQLLLDGRRAGVGNKTPPSPIWTGAVARSSPVNEPNETAIGFTFAQISGTRIGFHGDASPGVVSLRRAIAETEPMS